MQAVARRVRAVMDANNRALDCDDSAGFGTHRALLLSAVVATAGPVLEMGTGSFSTDVRARRGTSTHKEAACESLFLLPFASCRLTGFCLVAPIRQLLELTNRLQPSADTDEHWLERCEQRLADTRHWFRHVAVYSDRVGSR